MVLARRLYRTFAREEAETVRKAEFYVTTCFFPDCGSHLEFWLLPKIRPVDCVYLKAESLTQKNLQIVHDDLKNAFDDNEEAESAFSMFDKDMNGDISMQELEAVCVEIGRERKSIMASLKDLDSVVSKLDAILVFIVVVASLLVLLSLISTSAAGVLTSAGSAVSPTKCSPVL